MTKKKCSCKKEESVNKNLHDIHTMYCDNGELNLIGKDEFGKEFTLTICLYEAINWFGDKDYLKERLIQHIKES